MNSPVKLIVAIAAAVLVVALISWARGNPHHHGLDVGSLGRSSVVAVPVGHR
jgi:hypothetical protein